MRSLIRDNIFEQTFTDNNSTENMIRVTKDDNSYEIEMLKKLEPAWFKALNVVFTVNRENYSGTIHIRNASQVPEESVLYKIVFNTNDTCRHSLELSAINLEYSEGADLSENIPDRLWLKICKSSNNFYISANVYYMNVNLSESTEFDDYIMGQLYDGTYIPGASLVKQTTYTAVP